MTPASRLGARAPGEVPAQPTVSRHSADLLRVSTLALTLLEAVAAVVEFGWLDDVRALLAAGILLLAVLHARPLWRVLAGAFIVMGSVLIATSSAPESSYELYRAGMLTVTPVVALLVAVTRLNAVVLAGGYNLALAGYLSRRGGGWSTRTLPLYLAWLLAPILLAGALAQSYGSFQPAAAADGRRLLAMCVRALSIGLVWSPMAAPTAFALTLLDVPVGDYLLIALPASVAAFLLLLVTTRNQLLITAHANAVDDPAKVLRLLGFLGSLPLLVAVLTVFRGHVDLQVVLLAMLTVTGTWAVVDRSVPRAGAPGGAATAPATLAAEGVALYLSLGVFVAGVRLVTSEGLSWAASPTTAIAVAFFGAAACFLVGVHPVAVIAVLSPTVLALDPAYAAVGAFALCAGAQAVNVSSPFSPLSVVGSQLAHTTPWRVSTPVHWRFSLQQLALYGAVCAVALSLATP